MGIFTFKIKPLSYLIKLLIWKPVLLACYPCAQIPCAPHFSPSSFFLCSVLLYCCPNTHLDTLYIAYHLLCYSTQLFGILLEPNTTVCRFFVYCILGKLLGKTRSNVFWLCHWVHDSPPPCIRAHADDSIERKVQKH